MVSGTNVTTISEDHATDHVVTNNCKKSEKRGSDGLQC